MPSSLLHLAVAARYQLVRARAIALAGTREWIPAVRVERLLTEGRRAMAALPVRAAPQRVQARQPAVPRQPEQPQLQVGQQQ
jgi:hypothetical protein